MALNNWPRWIQASINKHFADGLVSVLTLLLPGQHRDDDDDSDRAELRIDGPHLREVTAGDWRARVDVNVYLVHAYNNSNIYVLQDNIGTIIQLFGDIQVYDYGIGTDNVGCLQLDSEIITRQTGQPKPDIKIERAFVDASYKMDFST